MVHPAEAELRVRASLLRGFAVPFGGCGGVFRDALAVLVHPAEAELRVRASLFRGFEIPFGCGGGVFCDALAVLVHLAEAELRVRASLFRGFEVPFGRGDIVFRDATATPVHLAQIELRFRVPLSGGFEVPFGRLGGVFRDAPAILIHPAQVKLRVRVSLLRGREKPFGRFGVVFRDAPAVLIHPAQIIPRARVSLPRAYQKVLQGFFIFFLAEKFFTEPEALPGGRVYFFRQRHAVELFGFQRLSYRAVVRLFFFLTGSLQRQGYDPVLVLPDCSRNLSARNREAIIGENTGGGFKLNAAAFFSGSGGVVTGVPRHGVFQRVFKPGALFPHPFQHGLRHVPNLDGGVLRHQVHSYGVVFRLRPSRRVIEREPHFFIHEMNGAVLQDARYEEKRGGKRQNQGRPCHDEPPLDVFGGAFAMGSVIQNAVLRGAFFPGTPFGRRFPGRPGRGFLEGNAAYRAKNSVLFVFGAAVRAFHFKNPPLYFDRRYIATAAQYNYLQHAVSPRQTARHFIPSVFSIIFRAAFEFSSPCAAALRNNSTALDTFIPTPSPLTYIAARLYCACAFP